MQNALPRTVSVSAVSSRYVSAGKAARSARRAAVVVPCDEDAVRVWLAVQPLEGRLQLFGCARLCAIASVYQNVAVWERRELRVMIRLFLCPCISKAA